MTIARINLTSVIHFFFLDLMSAGVSASRYAYMGGFNGTSNLEAGRQFAIPCKGTLAHSYVQSHQGFQDIGDPRLRLPDGNMCPDFLALVGFFKSKWLFYLFLFQIKVDFELVLTDATLHPGHG